MHRHAPQGDVLLGTLAVKSADPVADLLSLSSLACPLRRLSCVLRKTRACCSVQRSICADLRVKCAQFAATKKVMSFVFKYFLASFPLFLYFCALPRPGNFEPCGVPPFQSPAGACALSKSLKCAFKARISHSIGVRFRFVFEVLPFVFKNILASIVSFLVCFQFRAVASSGTFRPNLAPGWSPALACDNVSTK